MLLSSGWLYGIHVLLLFQSLVEASSPPASLSSSSMIQRPRRRALRRPLVARWAVHADNMLGQDDDLDQTTFSESVGGASRYGHGLTNSDSTGYQDDDGRIDAAIHPQAPLPPARGMSSSIQDLPSSTTLPSAIASDGPGSNHARLHADPQPILVPSTGNDAASSSSPIHMWTATMTVTLLAIGCAFVILL